LKRENTGPERALGAGWEPRVQGSKKTIREPGKIVKIVPPTEVEDRLSEIAKGLQGP